MYELKFTSTMTSTLLSTIWTGNCNAFEITGFVPKNSKAAKHQCPFELTVRLTQLTHDIFGFYTSTKFHAGNIFLTKKIILQCIGLPLVGLG